MMQLLGCTTISLFLEIHLSTIQQAVERRWLMEVGEYYHLWFLSSSLPHVFSEGAHEELVLVLSDHQLRILASTKSLGIWTLQLNGNHEYGLSDHSEIVKTAVQVSLEEFPLYISWVYKSKQFYELLKGGD